VRALDDVTVDFPAGRFRRARLRPGHRRPAAGAIGWPLPRLRGVTGRWESVVIATFGTVGGLGVGIFLGWALVLAASSEGIASFAAPPGQMVIVLLVGATVGVLAGLRPALRAAKLNVLAAIATE
jgi:putative ABC transport system permease protein